MAKILAISSQVIYGPVGLNAIVPTLQALGHDVLALPTVVLSNHPGHGTPTGSALQIQPYIQALENIGAFNTLDAIITGYFANAQQVEQVAHLISNINPPLVCVDPVLGDHGKLYVSEAVAVAIRDKLLPIASILMPNVFELSWLTGMPTATEVEAITAARSLNVPEVIATSIPAGQDVATLRITPSDVSIVKNLKRMGVPNGTGDMLSGLYVARLLGGDRKTALQDSITLLQRAIMLSGDTKILAVAEALA